MLLNACNWTLCMTSKRHTEVKLTETRSCQQVFFLIYQISKTKTSDLHNVIFVMTLQLSSDASYFKRWSLRWFFLTEVQNAHNGIHCLIEKTDTYVYRVSRLMAYVGVVCTPVRQNCAHVQSWERGQGHIYCKLRATNRLPQSGCQDKLSNGHGQKTNYWTTFPCT